MGNKIAYFDYSIFNGALNPIGEADKTLINTINQYSFCIAEQDVAFKEAYATDASGVGTHYGNYEEFFNAWYDDFV